MSELDQAWALLVIVAKKQIANCTSKVDLAKAVQSPAYTALKTCERGSFYQQTKDAAQDKMDTYRVVP